MGSSTNSPPFHDQAPFECCLLCALVLPFSPVFSYFFIRLFISFCCSCCFFARFSSAVCARKITQLVNCTNNMSALLQRSFKQGRECATNLRAGKRQDERVPTRYRSTGYGLVWFGFVWSALVWLPVFHHYSSVLKFRWGMKWKHVHQKIASTSSNKTQPQFGLNAWPKVLITHKQEGQSGSEERGTLAAVCKVFSISTSPRVCECACVCARGNQ